jgi:hypothetical protein
VGRILKGLQKCTDFYRKALAKGTPVADQDHLVNTPDIDECT